MLNLKYYQYWGKADKEGKCHHLLPYHCLEVAAVADVYLNTHTHLLNTMALALGFPVEDMKRLVLLFITLHDLGKFSICFQSQAPVIVAKLAADEKLRCNSNYHHDVLGQGLWEKLFTNLFIEHHVIWPKKQKYLAKGFNILMGASTGHHGQPSSIDNPTVNHCIAAFDSKDIEAAQQFYSDVASLFLEDKKFDLRVYPSGEAFTEACQRLSWWLSGLTILADWLGSNTLYFEYRTDVCPLSDYWRYAAQQAKTALAASGLEQAQVKLKQNFQTLFNKPTLRPLQQIAATITLAQHEQLFILEDMTGAGKTEAALLLAYRLMEQNLAEGIYFGLPTMATANGIYERLQPLYKHFFNNPESVSLILTHANSKLQKRFHESIGFHPDEDKDLKNELPTATAYCNAWLTDNRKKALMGHVGIGTVDQALLSVLRNKHHSLRLLGLFHKVLIVDEVHAYDEYMQELLCNLLEFHAASGGSAILLSATLTEKIRKNLIEAFCRARKPSKVELKRKGIYPLLTHACYESIEEIPVISNFKRELAIKLIDDKEDIKKHILVQLKQGNCVCWIRNTVYDAIEAYEEFKSLYCHEKITLFHARFIVKDRIAIEDKVKKLFGEKSLAEERAGQLLIATQVVEQSLDLDFDCMVTDLAPIDLVIQRAGRLQRHQRGERMPPILIIYGPQPKEDITEDWYQVFFPKASYVYPDPAKLWLGAKLLQERGKLIMPDDARQLIETVYGDESILQAPGCFQPKADKQLGKQRASTALADVVKLKFANGYYRDSSNDWPTDLRATTRLSDFATVTIFLARYAQGELFPWYADR